VRIGQAGAGDVAELTRLLWLDTHHEEPSAEACAEFAGLLAGWWAGREDAYPAFVARLGGPGIVGMAWVALVPRVPRPGAVERMTGDVQSVFVFPEHRGRGIGSAPVRAAAEHATGLGAPRVTVHSGRSAVPVYERLGFGGSRRLMQRPVE
jgi:GNAT superfamily N-acetyltransferase